MPDNTSDVDVERRIVTGLIVSTEFVQQVRRVWDGAYLASDELRRVARWCIEYYDRYETAPDRDIQAVYTERLKNENVPGDEAEYIEHMLDDMADEYGRGKQFNAQYLYEQTVPYFKSRKLALHQQEVDQLRSAGKIEEAEQLAQDYTPTLIDEADEGIELGSNEALDEMERAFDEEEERVVSFPGALGNLMNEHLVRDGFIGFLAKQKRGKTWKKLEIAMRAVRQRANVAFFQTGDMTQKQQFRRMGIYLAKRHKDERYCSGHYCPVGDCIYNQVDECEREDRTCDFGPFEDYTEDSLYENYKTHFTYENLTQAVQNNPDYVPCDSHTCPYRKGSIWMQYIPPKEPLTGKEARKYLKRYFKRFNRRFKLYTSTNMTIHDIRRQLAHWEKHDGFMADVIIVDHADGMEASGESEFRHKEFSKWKGLSALRQEKHALVVTSTWSNRSSFNADRVGESNTSEDIRKLGQVTAMFGLNQDPQDREKALGLLRVSTVVVREGEFYGGDEVTVLQDLRRGRPFLESY